MSKAYDVDLDVFTVVVNANGTRLRGIALVLSVMSLVLPALSISTRAMGYEVDVIELAGWSLIVPLSVLVAASAPAFMARWCALTDLAAGLCAVVSAVYPLVVRYRGQGAVFEVVGGGEASIVEVAIGAGVFSLMVTAAVMFAQALRSARSR